MANFGLNAQYDHVNQIIPLPLADPFNQHFGVMGSINGPNYEYAIGSLSALGWALLKLDLAMPDQLENLRIYFTESMESLVQRFFRRLVKATQLAFDTLLFWGVAPDWQPVITSLGRHFNGFSVMWVPFALFALGGSINSHHCRGAATLHESG